MGKFDFLATAPDRFDQAINSIERKPREIAFGVGIESESGVFGMVAGPFSDLAEALEEDGRTIALNADITSGRIESRDVCIIAFLPDWTEAVIYRLEETAWVKQEVEQGGK